MTAITPPEMRSINTILLSDGRDIHLDDIETAAQGQSILDDLDVAIDKIENQVSAVRDGMSQNDPGWRRRAEIALKRKRRIRPRLQQRIGELRRAERFVPIGVKTNRDRPEAQDRRIAFIDAAEAVLDRDLFVEIWARAKAMRPAAFEEAQS